MLNRKLITHNDKIAITLFHIKHYNQDQ